MDAPRVANAAVLSTHRLIAETIAAGLRERTDALRVLAIETCPEQLPIASELDVLVVALTENDDADELVIDLSNWADGTPIIEVRNDVGLRLPYDVGLQIVASIRHDRSPDALADAVLDAVRRRQG